MARAATTRTGAKKAPARARRAAVPAPLAEQEPAATPEVAPAGSADLAGALRILLDEVGAEVRAVSVLSEQIDDLVGQLNDARDEQARRLLVLDALRASVEDVSLAAFLDKAIRPRRTRVDELVPERLTEGS